MKPRGLQQQSPSGLPQPQPNQLVDHSVYVTKFIDYSSKYGLGYQLSDNSTGVFFNDATKIVIEERGTSFFYYERMAVSNTEK